MRRRLLSYLLITIACGALAPGASWTQDADPEQASFDSAMAIFNSADQYDSIVLFNSIISAIEGRGSIDEAGRQLLARAHFQLAEVHFGFGENDAAGTSLENTVRAYPSFAVNTSMISPKLAELFREKQSSIVGFVQSAVTPSDAVINIDGAPPIYGGQQISLLAGSYALRVERPGYTPVEQSLEVPAGQTTQVQVALTRSSAVLHVLTEVAGVTVFVNGTDSGVTALDPLDESAPANLIVDGVAPGTHTIELQSRGYRNRKLELEIADLGDYATDLLALDSMRGTVKLGGLMPEAVVRINGEDQSRTAGETASFEIPVGENRIEVDYRGIGRFVRDFEISDGQSMGFEVELRPLLALMGVLGGDRVSAETLQEGIQQFFSQSTGWSVADESDEREVVLAGTGLDTKRFRELSGVSATQIARVDWTTLQKACDERIGASAYLIAVLSDDLFASSADLWILPAAPHPALPQKIRVEVGGIEVVSRALAPIGERPTFTRPWVGVRLIESNAAEGLVVLNVTEGSPAATAGLKTGDIISSARNTPIRRLAELEGLLANMEPHSALQLDIIRPSGTSSSVVALGSSPMILPWTDPNTFYPLYLAWLEIESVTGQSEMEDWMVELNRASALMGLGSWSEAIGLLRSIQAPSGGGVGQAMADYWLGTALMRTDPNTYRDIALQALGRAASAEGARLYHNDGPLIAPLAEASRKSLAGGN
jgi:hypothetical protein